MHVILDRIINACDEVKYIDSRVKNAIEECESIDKMILYLIYENGLEVGAVDQNCNFTGRGTQAYLYTELKDNICKQIALKNSTINICLDFLERTGLIFQVQKNTDKEYCYAISQLGLETIKCINCM